jgi:hypothetical protein
MAIYPPVPTFSNEDRRILALLTKLLLEHQHSGTKQSNVAAETVVLSDKEAQEIQLGVRERLESREFAQAAYFVEAMTSTEDREDKTAREIFLSSRARNGRTRALASTHWAAFKTRLGIRSLRRDQPVSPMPLTRFLQMERRLLIAAGMEQQVVNLLMQIVETQLPDLQEIRDGRRTLGHGAVRSILARPFVRLYDAISPALDREITTQKLGAVMLLVADCSVLFTTRDWGVAGTLSTMAAAVAGATLD